MKYLDFIKDNTYNDLAFKSNWSSKTYNIIKDWEISITKNNKSIDLNDISIALCKMKNIITQDELNIKLNHIEKSIKIKIKEINDNQKLLKTTYIKLDKLKFSKKYIEILLKIKDIINNIINSIKDLNYYYSELINLDDKNQNNKKIKDLILKLENFKKELGWND